MLTDILLLLVVVLLAAIFYLLVIAVRRLAMNDSGHRDSSGSKEVTTILKSADKYARNGISEAVARDFKDIIIEKVEVGQHYLNPDFKLRDLAKLISLSKHQTSLILNEELGMDFNSFVNSFRIKKAIDLLSNNEKVQIGEVMYQVGFNNSTTFNRVFKKYTNLTPREFVVNHCSEK